MEAWQSTDTATVLVRRGRLIYRFDFMNVNDEVEMMMSTIIGALRASGYAVDASVLRTEREQL